MITSRVAGRSASLTRPGGMLIERAIAGLDNINNSFVQRIYGKKSDGDIKKGQKVSWGCRVWE